MEKEVEKYKENDVVVLPKEFENHTHTLIYLPGLDEMPSDIYSKIFSDKSFATPSTKIVILSSEKEYVNLLKKEVFSWYNIYKNVSEEDGLDRDEINKSCEYVFNVIRIEASKLNNDFSKIYIGGFSQGAVLSLQIALTFPEALGGAFIFSGYKLSYTSNEDNLKKGLHIFIGLGKEDTVIDYIKTLQSYNSIINYKNVHYYEYPNLKHKICDEELKDAQKLFIELTNK